MDKQKLDAEQLAALIDGRLDSRERAQVLAALGAADADTAAAFADAAAIVNELEPVRTAAGAVRFGDRAARRWQWLAASALAAAVITAAVLLRYGSDRTGYGLPAGPDVYAEAVNVVGSMEPASSLWANRGSGAEGTVQSQIRAVRIGASITDLSLALRSGDTAALAITSEIIRNVATLAGSGPSTSRYQELRAQLLDKSPSAVETSHSAAQSAASVAGLPQTCLGAWLEAVRLAARQNDSGFFARNRIEMPKAHAFDTVTMSRSERATLDRLRTLLMSMSATSIDVYQAATNLLAALTT